MISDSECIVLLRERIARLEQDNALLEQQLTRWQDEFSKLVAFRDSLVKQLDTAKASYEDSWRKQADEINRLYVDLNAAKAEIEKQKRRQRSYELAQAEVDKSVASMYEKHIQVKAELGAMLKILEEP